MIKRILIILAIVVLLGLLILWVIQGGPAAAIRTAKTFLNPLSLIGGGEGSGATLRLPWQPAETTRGPDMSEYLGSSAGQDTQDEGQPAVMNVGPSTAGGTADISAFGTPSPYINTIHLQRGNAEESDPSQEYLELDASALLSSPVVVSGWSLQSTLTGARVFIPEAAPVFVMGVVNSVVPITLGGNDSVFLTTGTSPFGVSFRENACSGYLLELRQFTPDLVPQCPSPRDLIPQTPSSLSTYGSACFTYIDSVPRCHFPGTALPADLSPACRSAIVNTFSYNGCVDAYRAQGSFALPTWRAYLNHTTELWNNQHDIIRLLDTQGRVVDVLQY